SPPCPAGRRLRGDRGGTRDHSRRRPGTLPSRRETIEGAARMTTCTRLSDRMPDVAHGTSRWTELEERHLAECADCRAEWELVTAASRLGATLQPPADPVLFSTV